jgi:putative copper export protein
VLAAGLWLGTLSVIFVTVLPFALRDSSRIPALRATIWSFSPIALGSAAVVVLSGTLNALAQLGSPTQLFSSPYGRVLLIKIGIVLALVAAGAYNWRVVRHRLDKMAGALNLRSSARTELVLAILVLVLTSILVATPPPHWFPGGQ